MNVHEIERIISERTGRTVTFGPTTFVDGAPRKKLFLDGIPLDFRWSPEASGPFREFRSQEDLIDSIIETINDLIRRQNEHTDT